MKILNTFFILGALLFSGFAWAEAPGTFGDGDPFPLSCVNLSGTWSADDGSFYDITQRACTRIKVEMQQRKGFNSATTIIPDNKARPARGQEWTGSVRHRWNTHKSATTIETYRYMAFDSRDVFEVVFLEKVNSKMVLESTYRTIIPSSGEAYREYEQKIFRKAQQ